MSKGCKEKRAERGEPRSNALTLQAAAQQMKAAMVHSGHRPFPSLAQLASLCGPSGFLRPGALQDQKKRRPPRQNLWVFTLV